MSNDALRTALESIGSKCEAISNGYLNSGGCCVYAWLLADWLKQQCNIKAYGRISSSDLSYRKSINSLSEIRSHNNNQPIKSVAQINDMAVRVSHVILQFRYLKQTWTVDSGHIIIGTGIKQDPSFDYELLAGRLSFSELKAMATNPRGWNRAFNRSAIPLMQAYISTVVL